MLAYVIGELRTSDLCNDRLQRCGIATTSSVVSRLITHNKSSLEYEQKEIDFKTSMH